MEIYHISDVIGLLGLPPAPPGRSSYYLNCPCCDDSPRKRHMNVNIVKDVFRCPRCGVSGEAELCPTCGSELTDGECPRGHTIVRCPDCGS